MQVRVTVRYDFNPFTLDNKQKVERVMMWVNGELIRTEVQYTYDLLAPSQTWVFTIPTPPPVLHILARVWGDIDLRLIADHDIWTTPSPATLPSLGNRIVRSMFNLTPTEVRGTPGLEENIRAAGINTLHVLAFNRADAQPGFEAWKAAFDAEILADIAWAMDKGFLCIGVGDELLRNAQAQHFILTSPWAEQAVKYAAAELNLVGVEMVDEIGGANPSSPMCEAHRKVIGWWREVNGPPLAWPDNSPILWERNAYSDYASRYPRIQEWRDGSPDGPTVWQYARAVEDATYAVNPQRPFMCLIPCAGLAGSRGGSPTGGILAAVWTALAYGACGFRVFGYDSAQWQSEKVLTGTKPGDSRWQELTSAFQSVAKREPQLLRPAQEPANWNNWILGGRPELKFAVNACDVARISPFGEGTIIDIMGDTRGKWVNPGAVITWKP